jgi:hypothetical protein
MDKAKDYFDELKAKGSTAMKDSMGDVESLFNELFGKKDGEEKTA